MSKKRKLKHFDSTNFDDELRKAKDYIIIAKEVKEAFQKFNCDTFEEVQKYLYKTTGFENYMFSADALNLKTEYVTLSVYVDKVDFSNYNEDCTELAPEFEPNLRERYSTYWSVEDTQTIEDIQATVNTLNLFNVGQSIYQNRDGSLHFNEIKWNNIRQEFSRRK